jgi:uncharacterized protein YdbL (DUF1318 family)
VTFARRAWLAAACALAAVPVLAQESPVIVEARQAGVVGERYDGYLGFPGASSELVGRQVGAANIKRRSLYTGLAARRRVSVQEVGIAAGCELLGTVKVGETYMLADGTWRRRGPRDPAPVPSYCAH